MKRMTGWITLALLSIFPLGNGIARAGSWVDSYWPLHDGDSKALVYILNGFTQTEDLEVSHNYNDLGDYQVTYSSPDFYAWEYYTEDGTNVWVGGMGSGWDQLSFDPPIVMANDTILQTGGTVTTYTTAEDFGMYSQLRVNVTISKAGTVVVPAGTFANCLKIVLSGHETVPSELGLSLSSSAILAPDVGIIKMQLKPNVWAQLVSGTVGGTDVAILALGAPKVTFKTPSNGQRVPGTNTTVAITGSVSGYVPGLQVYYAANSESWTNALLSGTNWSASTAAVPGTNIINAYAVDSVGRTSSVVSVRFQYVVTGGLSVQTVGKGTVTPNYTNVPLELGRNYKLTAKPAKGYAFTNWSGLVDADEVLTTNKAAVSFMMRSNLALTATFVDVTKPVLKITAPKAGLRWTSEQFTATGQVTDNGPGDAVWYQLNGGDWNIASGWTNWTANLALVPGTNTVRAYAVDAAGNRSLTNAQKMIYVVAYRLSDYEGPAAVGNRKVFDGKDYDGQLAQYEERIDDTNFAITCYSGKGPVTSYVRYVVKEHEAYGYYDSGTGNFSAYDNWDSFYDFSGGGSWGEDEHTYGYSLRFDPSLDVTNRMIVGQTISFSRSYYFSGIYQGQVAVKLQLLAITNVTVPAGYFPECLQMRTTVNVGGKTAVTDSWGALGFGLVKQVGISGDHSRLELIAYHFQPTNSPALVAQAQAMEPALGIQMVDGRPRFQLLGIAGKDCTVEYTTNLTAPDWKPLLVVPPSSDGRYEFTDPTATNDNCRFYRVKTQ